MDRNQEFLEAHTCAMQQLKEQIGAMCLTIRQRNKLTRFMVSIDTDISDKSIANIERAVNGASSDIISRLFHYYYRLGYVTSEEQEEFRRMHTF